MEILIISIVLDVVFFYSGVRKKGQKMYDHCVTNLNGINYAWVCSDGLNKDCFCA